MFGFHHRNKSLISVRELEKSEKEVLAQDEEVMEMAEVEVVEVRTPRQSRNLTMVYLLFLAEAIMASSLSSQVAVLVPSAKGCMGMDASFLRSCFECAYFLGSVTGVFWGWMADRVGRRKVVLVGLSGMATCCISMGFATNFAAFAALRFVAGAISSAVSVAGLAMLADLTHDSRDRTHLLARLPVIAFCGSLGPIAANSIRKLSEQHSLAVFSRYPGLSGQIACASLVLMVTMAEALLLEETLPTLTRPVSNEAKADCEKAAFLCRSPQDECEEHLGITMIEALNDDSAAPQPSRITLSHLLAAPSLVILLASFSLLSLHTSTFDILLPHLGHTASHEGGMGIDCSWLNTVTLVVQLIAALRVLKVVPFVVDKIGTLPAFRRLTIAFPTLYLAVPLVGISLAALGGSPIVSAGVSIIAMLAKSMLAGVGHVLVLLVALSAVPDAQSTGTTVGVLSIAEIYKALAVAISGLSYYLANSYSVVVINTSLWGALAGMAIIGAVVATRLRECPRVGTDIPESCLAWQGVFNAESEAEEGF